MRCAGFVEIVVLPNANANITPPSTFCELDAPLTLTAAQAGGTWSGTGITNGSTGEFSPAVSGAGSFEIVYTIAGQCGDSDTITVVVLAAQDATITAAGPFCENDMAITLSAADGGGLWSGSGITNTGTGIFNPSTAGPGEHLITYVIAGACGDSDTSYISVLETVTIAAITTDESCMDANNGSIDLALSGGSSPYTIAWNSGQQTDPITDLAPGSYVVVVTDSNGCSSTQSYSILGTEVLCFTPHIYIPNVFSPNGDWMNDVLFVRGEGISELQFFIYDRWGRESI